MNELNLFIEILVLFTFVVLSKKLFGRDGVIAWIVLASVLANVVQGKNASIFGLNAGIGHVLFSSTFLATDILSESYSPNDAKKAVWLGFSANLVFIVVMLIALRYIPSSIDTVNSNMSEMFGLNIRITASSMFWYLISNFGDVYLYNKLKAITNGKYLWLRNNVSTILFNCAENFGFAFFAFGGIYTVSQILEIALASTLIEIIVGIIDTPFLYIAVQDKREG